MFLYRKKYVFTHTSSITLVFILYIGQLLENLQFWKDKDEYSLVEGFKAAYSLEMGDLLCHKYEHDTESGWACATGTLHPKQNIIFVQHYLYIWSNCNFCMRSLKIYTTTLEGIGWVEWTRSFWDPHLNKAF